MEKQQVNSSNISEIGYDNETQTLEIMFHSGAVYQYADVPYNIYHDLMLAESHGKYFNQHIKNTYRYVRI